MPQNKKIRFSVALSNQNIAWNDYLGAVKAADDMAFETFWTFDHLMPIGGDKDGPRHHGHTTIAAVAAATTPISIHPLVPRAGHPNTPPQIQTAPPNVVAFT